jgi:hypothetical protein
MSIDPRTETPDMNVRVSLGTFHQTHNAASDAKALLEAGIEKLSTAKLEEILANLRAAQRLTDAEAGSDFMYATSYREEIRQVVAHLELRKACS